MNANWIAFKCKSVVLLENTYLLYFVFQPEPEPFIFFDQNIVRLQASRPRPISKMCFRFWLWGLKRTISNVLFFHIAFSHVQYKISQWLIRFRLIYLKQFNCTSLMYFHVSERLIYRFEGLLLPRPLVTQVFSERWLDLSGDFLSGELLLKLFPTMQSNITKLPCE